MLTETLLLLGLARGGEAEGVASEDPMANATPGREADTEEAMVDIQLLPILNVWGKGRGQYGDPHPA